MKPALAQFESMNKYRLVRVNMDAKSSEIYKKNIEHFSGNGIPYFAVLNANGVKIHGWAGGMSADDLVKTMKAHVK